MKLRLSKCGAASAGACSANNRPSIFWLLLLAAFCSCALACGPFFPNMMLMGGDQPVLTAPVGRYYLELDRAAARLKVPAPMFPLRLSTNSYPEDTREADLADLRRALKKRGDDPGRCNQLCDRYLEAREQLLKFNRAWEQWTALRDQANAAADSANNIPDNADNAGNDADDNSDDEATDITDPAPSPTPPFNTPPPPFPTIEIPAELPAEFADYFRGAMAWHRGDTNAARAAWEALLERPAAERRYKSVWAAFMLAKSWEAESPAKAITHFSLTRTLVTEGGHDSMGLAAASIGWQARMHLRAGQFEEAIDLYLQQLALGDGSAAESLRTTARRALEAAPATLDYLARLPRARAIITAHITSLDVAWIDDEDQRKRIDPWLLAVERAGITDVDCAEQLALASYQRGEWEFAQRWVNRATNAPVAQWVQAKLWLREGKVPQAAAMLGRLTRIFPLVEPTNSAHARLHENLTLPDGDTTSAGRQVLGELGVLRLHRREYAQALDALLRAGFWVDAAYVAERVLTVDEFKNYVDRTWPEVHVDDDEEKEFPEDVRPSVQSGKIRYVLARRLARANRIDEARAYYPAEWLPKYDQLIQSLNVALDTNAPRADRITHYLTAAYLTRSNGMELIGTEVGPDYTCWAGNYQYGPSADERFETFTNSVTHASRDELERADAHGVNPDERWHYRDHAKKLRIAGQRLQFDEQLAEALKLPDHTDEKAMALYRLGKRAPDLATADIAYKLLVRRCRKTELGDVADRQRWFPKFDENGRPIVTRKPKPAPAPETPVEPAEALEPAPPPP